jgi:predicted Zn-dependent protease
VQEYFCELADAVEARLAGAERYTATFDGEDSTFVRLNGAAVRQAGAVLQQEISLDLSEGRRHATGTLTLSGVRELDLPRLDALIADLRDMRRALPDDPYLLFAETPRSTEQVAPSALPAPEDALACVLDAARGRDLVGLWASGTMARGFASATGQRNWHAQATFNLDWSDYHSGDKAVKAAYAGTRFDPLILRDKLARAKAELDVLGRPSKTISPGRYRVALAPAALEEIASILAFGGFGLRAHRTRTSPLVRLAAGEAELAAEVRIVENTAGGVAPGFQSSGFLRPPQVVLVDKGRHAECLVSPRSSVEYGVPTNGAEPSEAPQSLEIAGGTLSRGDVLRELGTGVYVSNLWYMNYSDRRACRTTGMTRFATFWVEGGRIQAPLSVMRFDETLYRMFGSHLIGLTQEQDFILDANTYGGRSHHSVRLPGALVDDFTFTL